MSQLRAPGGDRLLSDITDIAAGSEAGKRARCATSALLRGGYPFFIVSAIALNVVLLVSSPAGTLLVYNINDSGAGSLRQAINDNNALGGGSTIVFSNNTVGTITLTTGELLITRDMTIVGPGANLLAINGNGSRVFHRSTRSLLALKSRSRLGFHPRIH